ncbi:MAG TPA: DUF72 domain-containing protein [Candidatus Thermoplasmatota archaeon]
MGVTRVGCAGWSYRDWVGAVYPSHVPAVRWLDAYAELFPIVEIDSTFYAIPNEATVAGWVDHTKDLPEFRFCAKLPQDLTHRALPKGNRIDAQKIIGEFTQRVIEPLERAGRLETLLVQLPPTFAIFEAVGPQSAMEALGVLLADLEPDRRKIAVEFRHGSWYEHVGERLVPDVLEELTGLHVAAAQVDGLGFRFTQSRTTPWTYFRLHGRRSVIPPSERSLSHAPYNYLYTKEEIAEVASAVRQASVHDESTIVVFNNHYRGQSAHNAMDLLEALGKPRPRPAAQFKRESKLDDFGLNEAQ